MLEVLKLAENQAETYLARAFRRTEKNESFRSVSLIQTFKHTFSLFLFSPLRPFSRSNQNGVRAKTEVISKFTVPQAQQQQQQQPNSNTTAASSYHKAKSFGAADEKRRNFAFSRAANEQERQQEPNPFLRRGRAAPLPDAPLSSASPSSTSTPNKKAPQRQSGAGGGGNSVVAVARLVNLVGVLIA